MALAVALAVAGFLAGGIDSIVGGGGLITLPSLILALGPGPLAIGSNKIPGFLSAAAALWVYSRSRLVWWKTGFWFSVSLFVGAWFGSSLSPLLPPWSTKPLLLLTVPVVLAVVFSKAHWARRAEQHSQVEQELWGQSWNTKLLLLGLIAGVYDGAWGPGGGTFMFLALIFGGNVPLLPAMATAKLANAVSAGASLWNYSAQGLVSPVEGLAVAVGAMTGAVFGAKLAQTSASRLVRPALVVVAILLLARVVFI
jgi:uncharacterized membrane protein YfcA